MFLSSLYTRLFLLEKRTTCFMGPSVNMSCPKSASGLSSRMVQINSSLDQGACYLSLTFLTSPVSRASPVIGQKAFSSKHVKSCKYLPKGAPTAKCLHDGWLVGAQWDLPSYTTMTPRLSSPQTVRPHATFDMSPSSIPHSQAFKNSFIL